MQKSTRSILSEVPLGPPAMEDSTDRTRAVRKLAFELAEFTLNPGGVPDAEDWEIAELLFESSASTSTSTIRSRSTLRISPQPMGIGPGRLAMREPFRRWSRP